ncbi:hypothetical protein KCV03_g390, partial [Aureobasidium melanogenum]
LKPLSSSNNIPAWQVQNQALAAGHMLARGHMVELESPKWAQEMGRHVVAVRSMQHRTTLPRRTLREAVTYPCAASIGDDDSSQV